MSTVLTRQKQKLNALKLNHLVEQIPDIVSVYNPSTGEYIYVSQAIEKILGYSPEYILEGGLELVKSLIYPEDRARILKSDRLLVSKANNADLSPSNKKPLNIIEFRIRRQDGSWIWVCSKRSVYGRKPDGSVQHILSITSDITASKHDQQRLLKRSHELEKRVEQHAERLELALEGSKMGTWEWNVDTSELIWSPEMMRLYGLDPDNDTISYEKFFAALHPDHREEKKKVLTHALETGQPYQIEHRCVWPDGSVHWILGQGKCYMKEGKPYRMVGTAMNISERKATEAALEASILRYKALFDSAIIGICIIDTDGVIHEANDRFLAMLGHNRKTIKGKLRWESITPLEHRTMDQRKLKELIASGEAKPWEKEYICKDGSLVPVLVGVVRIPHTPNLCVQIAIDTSEEHHLMDLNQAKDEFISLASHQLRTPATGVKQFLGMLLGGFVEDLPPQHADLVQLAYESNERQIQIINDLLKVARVDAGTVKLDKEDVDMVAIINEILDEQASSFFARHQKVDFKHKPTKLMARVDKSRLRMVLENIIDNASKYTYPDKKITVTLKQQKGTIEVQIEDEGVGIGAEDMEKIFKKFSRVDNPLSVEAGGTGLGLHWAKRIVDLHNGTISVVSTINKGSVFTVSLPKIAKV